jgi:hypothetical protein
MVRKLNVSAYMNNYECQTDERDWHVHCMEANLIWGKGSKLGVN